MSLPAGQRTIAVAVWALLATAALVPVGIAATSPLQASREPLWIIGGMAGVIALALLLVQPLLASRFLPGMNMLSGRRWHRWIGSAIVLGVIIHVVGLYLSSPDDIADALLLVAPTPFAVYGVIGLASVVLTAGLVAARSKLRIRYNAWRIIHNALAVVVVISSILHAILIEGAMGEASKAILCGLVFIVTVFALLRIYGKRTLGKTSG